MIFKEFRTSANGVSQSRFHSMPNSGLACLAMIHPWVIASMYFVESSMSYKTTFNKFLVNNPNQKRLAYN